MAPWVVILAAVASQGVVLEQPSTELGPHAEFFVDEAGDISIERIRAGEFDAAFKSFSGKVPNFGFSNSVYWLRFEVVNRLPTANLVFSNRYGIIDLFELYVDLPGALGTLKSGGDHQPFTNRYRPHKSIQFAVTIPTGETAHLWIRAQTDGSMQLPMLLESEEAFDSYMLADTAMWVFFYGLMLAMAIYHGFLYLSLRTSQYLYCAVFLLLNVITNAGLNGDTLRYVFPDSPYLGNLFVLPFLAFSNGFFFLLTQSLLDLGTWRKKWHDTFTALFWVYAIFSLLTFVLPYNVSAQLIMPLVLVSPALIFLVAYLRWRGGYQPARLFLMAWPAFIAAIILSALQKKGVLPTNSAIDGFQVFGSVLGATLVAFALADKIHLLQTERDKTSQALRKSYGDLELALNAAQRANIVKSHFLANMSHEFRTPMNALLNLPRLMLQAATPQYLWFCSACDDSYLDEVSECETLDQEPIKCPECAGFMKRIPNRDEEYSKPEQLSMLKRVQESAHELNHVLSGVLDFAQIEAGFLKLCHERVSVSELVRDASALVSQKFGRDPNSMEFAGPENTPWVACDATYMVNVLVHLLDNAYKFSPLGSKVRVSVEANSQEDGMVRFSVLDEGPGVSAERKETVFNGFSQVDEGHTRTHRGSGLGLAICKGIVHEHGGSIWIEDRPQGGSSISFTLPHCQ